MIWLETRIPPPLVALIVAVAMWALAGFGPVLQLEPAVQLALASAMVMLGLFVAAQAVRSFGRAKTTINPVDIQAASSLVTDGIFQLTRNPMYLGMATVLIGWAIYLASPLALLGPLAFVLFMNRFQILPEERMLRAKFGASFADYEQKVRRWL